MAPILIPMNSDKDNLLQKKRHRSKQAPGRFGGELGLEEVGVSAQLSHVKEILAVWPGSTTQLLF